MLINNKAIFLDRDGVINKDYGYVFQENNFDFIDGIFEFTKKFTDLGFLVFVITNQSGIARGYYKESDFENISNFMKSKFLEKSINISKIYHCPCHPEYSKDCECRKPKPTMLIQAKDEFQIDFQKSLFIGDNKTDFEAGEKAGIKYNYIFNPDNMNFDNIVEDFFNKDK